MSIWTLLTFAVCMAAASLTFTTGSPWAALAYPVFVVTLVIFVLVLLIRGIRRPVI